MASVECSPHDLDRRGRDRHRGRSGFARDVCTQEVLDRKGPSEVCGLREYRAGAEFDSRPTAATSPLQSGAAYAATPGAACSKFRTRAPGSDPPVMSAGPPFSTPSLHLVLSWGAPLAWRIVPSLRRLPFANLPSDTVHSRSSPRPVRGVGRLSIRRGGLDHTGILTRFVERAGAWTPARSTPGVARRLAAGRPRAAERVLVRGRPRVDRNAGRQ